MIRFAALLVAASVLAAGMPAAADGIPIEKRPTMTQKIKKKRIVRRRVVIEKKTVVEKKAPPVVVAAPPPPPPAAVWMPGHWTWNAPMSTHVWVPGMYVWPTPVADEQSLAQWRIGKWLGFGRDD
jgi:hypothetical protein